MFTHLDRPRETLLLPQPPLLRHSWFWRRTTRYDLVSFEKIGYRKAIQIFNDPLHYAKIIHHLNECDEKDDRCQLGGTKIRRLDTENGKWDTVLTKNQCFLMVSVSKKKVAPASAWFKKSLARVAIHLNIENPAPVFKTNNATTCCKKSPTMTVGLMRSYCLEGPEWKAKRFYQGISFLFADVTQNPSWKTKRPRTLMARSPKVVPWYCCRS